MCVSKHLANGHHVLMDCCGSQVPVAHHLHKGRQLLVAYLVHAHVTKVRQDAVVHALQKDGDVGCCKLTSLDPALQALDNGWQQVSKLGAPITACLNLVGIQLSSLDVEKLLGLADGSLLVGGLEALCVGPAF